MGTYDLNPFSGFSGKVGNVVSCYRHGKYYLRTLPVKVNQPDTDKQLAQRMRFRLVQSFLQSVKVFIKIGFGGYAIGKSALNAAMSFNLQNAVEGEYPDLFLNFSKAFVSRGLLSGATDILMTGTTDKIRVQWNPVQQEENKNKIMAGIVLFLPDENEVFWRFNKDRHSEGVMEISVMPGWLNTTIIGYLFFFDERIYGETVKKEYISDSCYAGKIMVK